MVEEKRTKLFLSLTFFALVFALIFYAIQSVSYLHEARCVGPAFDNPSSPTFRNGKGKCEIRFSLKTSLRAKPIYSWYTSYQGEFKDGVKHGSGEYINWSVFNQYSHPPFEGKDKISYQGTWENDVRQGFGIFSHFSGLSFGGIWEKGKLTCEKGWVELRWTNSKDEAIRSVSFNGGLRNALPHGSGALAIKFLHQRKINEIKFNATFDNGLLRKASDFSLEPVGGSNVSVVSAADERKEGAFSTAWELKYEGKQYSWNGAALTHEGTSSSNVDSLLLLLRGIYDFQGSISEYRQTIETYEFENFEPISRKSGSPQTVKEEL